MPGAARRLLPRTGQPAPADEGAFVRCALESLALKYRWTIERLESILGTTIRTIHVVGGGSRNALLCQFTADACGRPVHAGPVEATAAGNVLLQAMARGRIGSLADARAVVARSFPRHLRAREPPPGTRPPGGSRPWCRREGPGRGLQSRLGLWPSVGEAARPGIVPSPGIISVGVGVLEGSTMIGATGIENRLWVGDDLEPPVVTSPSTACNLS